jgi:photosystem II stability/assembly factor-like uncharacterized protein
MSPDWQPVCRAPAGGTILQIAAANGGLWLASPAGLFNKVDSGWQLSAQNLPLIQPAAVFAGGKILLVSGMNGEIYRSLDQGLNWETCRKEQSRAPVLCFTASPNLAQDGVLLAGTAGDGILRSRDSGRTWHLSNFGLRDFTIFSLSAGPKWDRREPVLAGAEHGLYISPNAGRAWKPAGLESEVILALACWLGPDGDESIFVGLEEKGLYRSVDNGGIWVRVDTGIAGALTVNAIACHGSNLLVGTSEVGLLRSRDRGLTWVRTEEAPDAIMCLAHSGEKLWLGTAGYGLWSSQDGGGCWAQEKTLPARRFHALVEYPTEDQNKEIPFLALSIDGGIWTAEQDWSTWVPLRNWPDQRPAFDLVTVGETLLASSDDGVWKAIGLNETWRKTLDDPDGVTVLALGIGRIWTGNSKGIIRLSEDSGESWSEIESPVDGFPLSCLLETTGVSGRSSLYAACFDEALGQSRLFCLEDVMNLSESSGWELIISERSSWPRLFLASGGADGGQIMFCNGDSCFLGAASQWERSGLPTSKQPVTSLTWDYETNNWLISGGGRLWVASGESVWSEDVSWNAIGTPSAIRSSPDGRLFNLTSDGTLWTRG